jgi:hypothetical protein
VSRTYTRELYQADLARLDALRASSAPGLRETLAAAVIADAELVPAPTSGVQRRRDTAPGGFVAAPAALTIPATPAALRAAGLGLRPSARGALRCHWLAVVLAIAAALLGTPGCIWEPPPTERPTAFWPADAELADAALAAAARIEAATGVQITVAHDPQGAVPIVWAGAAPDREWWGQATHTTRGAPIVLIAEQTPPPLRATLVLHELLHTLGARHVASGAGVLSPEIWKAFALTAADLESICSEAACERFEPEASE